ncbi:hypothetical protein MUK70_21385 [Dyadobacter chenwenxiniae]|uniref:Uncharacterized protein n=1 Tax=Dyadobacter chenwenxiniae TaxID=2906456 RepID=A0A9X1TDC1_9BACT|nr:hypothetical protein [Dyadobacter chenwenxiniae]MCF0061796.1 hypothetical protein [Dyadobacter chenwenxiniae]UON81612.1 hypothetical protein MUK70_21385 [Dyadobacter chenwenxiniae]
MLGLNNKLERLANFYGFYGVFIRPTSPTPPTFQPLSGSRESDLEDLRLQYRYQRDISEQHLLTIKELVSDEETRHSSIETKIGNVITQAGLVFSITAVIAPFFNDTLSSQKLGIKIFVLIIFALAFSAYVTSILFATQIFGINKFVYKKTSVASVIDSGSTSDAIFVKRVKDLIYQHRENQVVNDKKADILIYANRWFVSGFILSGLLTGLITVSLLFVNKPDEKEKENDRIINSLNSRLLIAESRLTQHQFTILSNNDFLSNQQVGKRFDRSMNEIDSIRFELKKLKALIHK